MTTQTSIELNAYLADMKARQQASWPKGLSRDIAYPLGERPLSEHLSHWAQVRPDAPSIFFYGNSISWAELNAQANRFAALLAARGLRNGDVELLEVMCPACGECFEVVTPAPGELPADVDYDCEICCRPMRIEIMASTAALMSISSPSSRLRSRCTP